MIDWLGGDICLPRWIAYLMWATVTVYTIRDWLSRHAQD